MEQGSWKCKVKGQRSKDKGQRTKVKGQWTKAMDRSFEGLRVWQQSRIFVNSIYDIMKEVRDYGFRDQIQRAAVSIMNNIAEGSESGSDAKYVNFLQISRGSCSEVRSMLYLCLDRKMINQETFDKLKSEAISISNQIYRLIESISQGQRDSDKGQGRP